MKELVVVSGKGGTGKTSMTASLAALAGRVALADCDVDASDLHLVLKPDVRRREPFHSGNEAIIRSEACIGCGLCANLCRFDAIHPADDGVTYAVDEVGCEGCGVCVRACPVGAIAFPERTGGESYLSDTRFGPMAHARLTPGAENSGKLTRLVREEARKAGEAAGLPFLLTDGPPGVGCAAISALTGADAVLAVTEPTLSGAHDLARVLDLARYFRLPMAVCVNKWDIHPGQTEAIERMAQEKDATPVGRIRYDAVFVEAQIAGMSVIERPPTPAAGDIRNIWNRLVDLGFIGRHGKEPTS